MQEFTIDNLTLFCDKLKAEIKAKHDKDAEVFVGSVPTRAGPKWQVTIQTESINEKDVVYMLDVFPHPTFMRKI